MSDSLHHIIGYYALMVSIRPGACLLSKEVQGMGERVKRKKGGFLEMTPEWAKSRDLRYAAKASTTVAFRLNNGQGSYTGAPGLFFCIVCLILDVIYLENQCHCSCL